MSKVYFCNLVEKKIKKKDYVMDISPWLYRHFKMYEAEIARDITKLENVLKEQYDFKFPNLHIKPCDEMSDFEFAINFYVDTIMYPVVAINCPSFWIFEEFYWFAIGDSISLKRHIDYKNILIYSFDYGFAVGLTYNRLKNYAPFVSFSAKLDPSSDDVEKILKLNNALLIANSDLAKRLYENTSIHDELPEAYFNEVVAEIYAPIFRQNIFMRIKHRIYEGLFYVERWEEIR